MITVPDAISLFTADPKTAPYLNHAQDKGMEYFQISVREVYEGYDCQMRKLEMCLNIAHACIVYLLNFIHFFGMKVYSHSVFSQSVHRCILDMV